MSHDETDKFTGMRLLRSEARYLLWPWIVCMLLPTPFLLFYRAPEGRSLALNAFFLGCMVVVARSLRRDIQPAEGTAATGDDRVPWWNRIWPLGVVLLGAATVFSVVCLLFNNPNDFGSPMAEQDQGIWLRAFVFRTPHDFVAPMLAFMAIIPSLGMMPFFVLVTRRPLAAIIFTSFTLGSMKLLGASVVVSIYGWDADAQGRTKMPWNHPDLLVWLFWIFSAAFSVTFYILAARKFRGFGGNLALQGASA